MHNIKKTAASEAHAINEERRRAEKMKLFQAARTQIFKKSGKGEFDEEILSLTAELLKKNPDIYSFWGIRRKTLKIIREPLPDEESNEHEKRVKKLYDDELELTKEALFSNPKSYGAWYHRFLTFKSHPSANLSKELALCDRALSVDGRNFHCWDHRRAIAAQAGLTDADELLFSDKLIAQNPSNYSAWHYRATLLPRIQPDETGDVVERLPVSEDCLNAEFEKTQNVVCYNSEDQTAWTYSRWLCEAACAWEKDETAHLVTAKQTDDGSQDFIVTFNRPVTRQRLFETLNEPSPAPDVEPVTPFKCSEQAKRFQCVESWRVTTTSSELTIRGANGQIFIVTSTRPYENREYIEKSRTFGCCHRAKPRELLEKFAEVCEELIKIDKGEVPWEFIALARTKLLIHGATLENVKEVGRLLEKMKRLDPQRAAMYGELLSDAERSSIREASVELTPTPSIV